MQYPTGYYGVLVAGFPITFNCTVNYVGNMPASAFANGITVSGPGGYVSHGGSAVKNNGSVYLTYVTTLSNVGNYTTWCLGGMEEANTVTFTVAATETTTIDPLYQVVSILYAPPGNQSSQGYGDNTTGGTTTTIGSSFTFAEEVTYTSQAGTIPILDLSASGSDAESYGFSTTSNNSSAFTTSWIDAINFATDDNSNTTYNPAKSDAINHNLDSFVIWLNPQVTILSDGMIPLSYTVNPQPTTGVSAIVADMLPGPVPAISMEPTAGSISTTNPSGISTVPLSYLQPQAIANDQDNGNAYMPGLAAICKNQTYYPNNCAGDPNGQCGCTPADFAPILALDPLLNYNTTTYTANPVAGTVSPLESDASGASVCAENPVPTTANCRYVIVPIETKSTTPLFEPLSGSAGVTYTVTDGTTTVETIGTQSSINLSSNVGWSYSFGPLMSSIKTTDTWTWTQTESVGNSSGKANSMSVLLKTSDAGCGENVNVYEDTVYHTFAFQVPTGSFGCN
ncbi:MAG: hypothetical protein ABR906_00850 [Terracidiphilus sp.]|jgi:hypothetical protein